MDILMNDINGMVLETDMNIKEYAESTIQLIDNIDYIDTIEASYFTEAKKSDDKDDVDIEKQKSLLEKIKASVVAFFDRLIHLVPNLIKKIRASARTKRVDDLGKRLNKMSKAGVDLGKLKVSIPNIQMYDSFVMQLVTEYAIKFDTKYTDAFVGFMTGPSNKIDKLINNLNRMTSELSSGEATKNNISKILKNAQHKYPIYAAAHRSSTGASGIADHNRRSNAYFDNEVKKAIANGKVSDLANESVTDKSKNMSNVYTEGIGLTDPSNASDKFTRARYFNYKLIGYNIEFNTVGSTIFSDLGRFFSNAPRKVKTEEITVQALYKRTMDMKLDVLEKRFTNNINQSRTAILKGMTLEEFAKSDDKNKRLVKAAQKLCELLNAYFRFELAELNYYYRILIEVDSKLSIKEAKEASGPITVVTKESTDEIVDMEDFMDLESFVSDI